MPQPRSVVVLAAAALAGFSSVALARSGSTPETRRAARSAEAAGSELERIASELRAEIERHRDQVEEALERLGERDLRVGIFDPARVASRSLLGRDVEERFNRFRIALEAELAESQRELERLAERERARMPDLSEQEKEAARERLRERIRDHGALRAEVAEKLERRHAELMREIDRALSRAVRQLAEERSLSLVLRGDAVDYSVDALEVSDELVRLMNEARREEAETADDGAR